MANVLGKTVSVNKVTKVQLRKYVAEIGPEAIQEMDAVLALGVRPLDWMEVRQVCADKGFENLADVFKGPDGLFTLRKYIILTAYYTQLRNAVMTT